MAASPRVEFTDSGTHTMFSVRTDDVVAVAREVAGGHDQNTRLIVRDLGGIIIVESYDLALSRILTAEAEVTA